MIILEKWNPKKPISVIYYEGEKERYYTKRFLIENPNKEELIITEHPKSQMELISTDWRPVVEIEYVKQRGKDQKPNDTLELESFIAIKGIKALGNQVTSLKVRSINALNPLPYDEPEEQPVAEIEVVDEESLKANSEEDSSDQTDSDQPTLF